MMNWRDPYPEMGPVQDAYGPKPTGMLESAEKSSVSSAIEAFDIHLKQLGEIVRHLEMLRDRVQGPRPQEVRSTTDGSEKVPHSLISSIHLRRNNLALWVGLLEAATRDLENSL